MRSIRRYLLTRLAGGAAAVLVVAGAAVYLAVARSLARRFDENLADRVQGFASILFQTADELVFEFSDELMPEFAAAQEPAYFELTVVGGDVLERSVSLGSRSLEVPVAPGEAPSFWSAPLPDGRPGRYVARVIEVHHVYPEEGPDRPDAARVLVTIARGREGLVAAERELLAWCAGACLALCGLIGFVAWRSVERGLAPARRLAAALDALDVERLPERVELGAVPSELAPVAEKSDALIRRVGEALQRERRSSADIAHELRTPISEIVTVTEVALRNGHDPEHSRRALGAARDVAWRMGQTVATLLRLARLDSRAERLEPREVELAELVRDALAHGPRGPRVENGVRADDRLVGDPEVLRIVVGNLIVNALHYTPRSGVVRLCAERDGPRSSLTVENGPVDLTPDDLRSLVEPFWRKDGARSDRAHSGLGLALSHALAERAGLALEFSLESSTFRARLGSRG